MKYKITENQYKSFISESTKLEENLDEYKSILQIVINKMFKKKYEWFEGIELETLTYFTRLKFIGIKGTISVDMEWGAKQWRDYYYSKYFPGNAYWKTGQETDSVSFGDIIGGELGNEIKNLILDYFNFVTGISAKTLSWSWLMTKFIEKPESEELVTEEISTNTKVKAMDKVLQIVYPNQYMEEHAGSTLILTDEEDAYILFKYDWKKDTLYYDFYLTYKPFETWLPFDEFEYHTSFINLLRDYSEFRFGKRPQFVHTITA